MYGGVEIPFSAMLNWQWNILFNNMVFNVHLLGICAKNGTF
jgi:hypothetical protein